MDPSVVRGLRAFVVVSLVLGALALLAGARIVWALPPGGAWIAVVAIVWSAGLAGSVLLASRSRGPWSVPAGLLIGSLMVAAVWARFDDAGHLVLSALTPVVALIAGIGALRRERWAWAAGLVLVAGFGPLFLTFAPFPPPVLVGAFAVFLADALALLALTESFLEKPAPT